MKTPKMPRSRASSLRYPASHDICPSCATSMRPSKAVLTFPVNGEQVRVRGASHLSCPRCGEALLCLGEVRELRETAMETYRQRHGLLSADEIRALRECVGLRQGDLARLLRLGASTISRWEAGRKVQTAAMDTLLRLLRDVPGNLAYLRKSAA